MNQDLISRQGVIEVLSQYPFEKVVNCISIIEELPSAQPDIARDIATIIENERDMRVILKNGRTETHECDYQRTETHDLVSRQSAIDSVREVCENCEYFKNEKLIQTIKYLPSVQPTLYGYKIEHLAYIARVMEKKGITAEQAAESFDDMGTAIRLLIEEITRTVEESVREMREMRGTE